MLLCCHCNPTQATWERECSYDLCIATREINAKSISGKRGLVLLFSICTNIFAMAYPDMPFDLYQFHGEFNYVVFNWYNQMTCTGPCVHISNAKNFWVSTYASAYFRSIIMFNRHIQGHGGNLASLSGCPRLSPKEVGNVDLELFLEG